MKRNVRPRRRLLGGPWHRRTPVGWGIWYERQRRQLEAARNILRLYAIVMTPLGCGTFALYRLIPRKRFRFHIS